MMLRQQGLRRPWLSLLWATVFSL